MSQSKAYQRVNQENNIFTFKIHLFSLKNTNQTNLSIFPNRNEEKFNVVKINWNVSVQL